MVEACRKNATPVDILPSPLATEIKDAIWRQIAEPSGISAATNSLQFCIIAPPKSPLKLRSRRASMAIESRQGKPTMTVRAGREFLAIPGPTTMPDEVLQAMHRPALDIYSSQMVELTESLLADLSKLFATKGNSYIYIANGHGAWEATLTNVLSRGDKVLVLESGRFAIGWGEAARRDGRRGRGAEGRLAPRDPARRGRGAAAAGQGHKIKAILAVQVDTASGAYNDIEAIGKAIKASGTSARCSWSTPWRRSAACRSRWTPGASMSRCRARKRA